MQILLRKMLGCRGKVTADVLMNLIKVEAKVDMGDSENEMSTQCLPRFGPSLWR